MARDFNGSTQYGQASRDFSAYSTLTIAGWLNADTWAGGGGYNMIVEHTADGGSTNGGFAFYFQNSAGGILVVSHVGNVGLNYGYASTGSPSTGVWHSFVCVFDFTKSTNEVDLYWNGSLQSLTRSVNNNNSNTHTFANSTLNVAARNGGSLHFDGKIERLAAWSVDLGADHAASWHRGVPALRIRPDARINDWPLWGAASPEPDECGVVNVTLTNSPAQVAGPSANRPFDGANWWPGAFTSSGAATTTPNLIGGNLIRPNLVRGRLAA